MATSLPSDLKPDRIKEVSHSFNTTVIKFEKSKNQQRFSNQSRPTERFRLEWKLMSLSQMQTLMDHFDDRRGKFKGWYLDDERLTAQKFVYFVEDSLKFTKRNHYFSDVSIEVETQ